MGSSRGRSPGRPPGTARGGTKENLLRVARELLCETGSHDATIRQIAERADVNPALLHYYFGTKAGLQTAVLEQIAGEFREQIGRLPHGGSARDRLERIVRECADVILGSPFIVRMIVQDLLPGEEDRPPNPIAQVFVEAITDLVHEGIASGELRQVDPKLVIGTVAANCLAIAIASPVLRGTPAADVWTHELFAEAVPEMLFNGLARTDRS